MSGRGAGCIGLIALIVSGAAAPSAFAQANRPWVDPPAELKAPAPVPSPQPEPVQPVQPVPPAPQEPAARPEATQAPPPAAPPQDAARPAPSKPSIAQTEPASGRAVAARDLAVRYLRSWSGATEDNLDTTAEFYAPRVLFHGRLVSLRNLMREKRRFIRRWPERRYVPQDDTIQVACEARGDDCAVQSLFTFSAANPRRERRTQGVGALQLVVSFVDNQPIISAESSMVLDQGPDDQTMTPEDSDDE